MAAWKNNKRIGTRYGYLVVISRSHYIDNHGTYWNCKCDCGNEIKVQSSHLTSGKTSSCGCLRKKVNSFFMKKTHDIGDHLYFIQNGDFVKIGRTSNIKNRLSQLQVSNPTPLKVLNFIENKGHLEKDYHQKYNDFLVNGEWFKLKESELEYDL